MDYIIKFLNENEGVIAVILAIIPAIIFLIKKVKKREPNIQADYEPSNDRARCLNEPIYLKDKLLERNNLCNKIVDKIKTGDTSPFSNFAILGVEGIGKTLFCQNLFRKLKTENIYLGWVECNNKQSIFDFIKNNFKGFFGKNKDEILELFENFHNPLVIFIDQINQNTNLSEIEDIDKCHKVSVVISGLLKKEQIYFIPSKNRIELKPLNEDNIRIIFEKESKESYKSWNENEINAVQTIISTYIRGNPYLAKHFAVAKKHGHKTWNNVLESFRIKKYDVSNVDYIKIKLNDLYKLDKLENDEKDALIKLSIFSSLKFVNEVFNWNKIQSDCIERLNKTYWLEKDPDLLYGMDEHHKDAIRKVLGYGKNLKELIVSITDYISEWERMKDEGFEELSYYIEDILKNIKGYAPDIMNERNIIDPFAYTIASQYHFSLHNNIKALEWLGYCNPVQIEIIMPGDINQDDPIQINTINNFIPRSNKYLLYKKARLELFIKMNLFNIHFNSLQIEEAYLKALSFAENFDDYEDKQLDITQNYFVHLDQLGKHEEIIKYCKDYFDENDMSFNNHYNCALFYRYLCAVKNSNNLELLNTITTDEIISSLWNNNEKSITIAWSYRKLFQIFKEKNDSVRMELCKKRMVVLINRDRCFWHNDLHGYFESKEEFMEYMHSNDNDLKKSLSEALEHEDGDAFYLEGRYQESKNNYDEAIKFYEKSRDKDNLKGICSLGQMYYKGKGKKQNYEKACGLWKYAAEREHKGSLYWIGILLLNENYNGTDFDNELKEKNISKEELVFDYLYNAAKLGSKGAQKLLYTLDNESLNLYYKLIKTNPIRFAPIIADFLRYLIEFNQINEKYNEVEKLYIEIVDVMSKIAKENPDIYLPQLADIFNDISCLKYEFECYEEAEENSIKSIEIRRKLIDVNPDANLSSLANTLANLAFFQIKTEKFTEAERYASESVSIYKELYSKEPEKYFKNLIESINVLISIKEALDKSDEAVELKQQVNELNINK